MPPPVIKCSTTTDPFGIIPIAPKKPAVLGSPVPVKSVQDPGLLMEVRRIALVVPCKDSAGLDAYR